MLRPSLDDLPASRIREVAQLEHEAGIGRDGVLKFWFGEGDLPTPEFIRRAAIDALAAGDTFYNHNLGRIELREAIAAYVSRLHGVPVAADRFAVTSAGVNALALVSQALLEPGDRAVRFGHTGVTITARSPGSSSACDTSASALTPALVTATRSAAIGAPCCRDT
jgi:aspartate/methionine/tyrosine aminotransferase